MKEMHGRNGRIGYIGLLFCLLTMGIPAIAQDLLQYVQPMAGTAAATTPAARKHGEGTEQNANTIPAVGWPFGMTQWTAQTRPAETKCIPPYFYKDSLFGGFRGTHWISGSCMQDYGSVTIFPVAGRLSLQAPAIPFSHANETAGPAYYSVDLPTAQLRAEMTATLRCGLLRFTMQRDDSLYLLITPNSDRGKGFIRMNAATGEIWGYNPVYRIYQGWGNPAGFSGWFYIRVQKEAGRYAIAERYGIPAGLVRHGVYSNGVVFEGDSIRDKKDIGVFVGFALKKGDRLLVRVGTSFSSLEGAKKNLQQEIGDGGFEQVCRRAKDAWQQALSQMRVYTSDEKDKRVFYTSLYHALQHPRLFSDVDGHYPGFAGSGLQQMKAGMYYDDFSMWDIYRAQLPLLELLRPAFAGQLVQSLVLKGGQGGWLPIFPCWNSYTAAMVGDHGTAFIASAWAKGIRGYDTAAAYRLMRRNAFETADAADYTNGKGRRALPSYLRYGYIPMEDSVAEAFHKKEQVSRTLEYAYDDYALSVVAEMMNKKHDAEVLRQRALSYRNVFDSTVGMVRGRYADGRWWQPFQADRREPYITEGTPRQYTMYVPQDVPGLARLMGGPAALENALDSLFIKNEYWHGNEPGHQIPFMYNYTAAPWKTQRAVRTILAEEYSDGPGGLSGNDDAGQMSAWYVFAAAGIYPMDPVSGEYMICAPLFDSVLVRLPGFRVATLRPFDKLRTGSAQGDRESATKNERVLKIRCHKATAAAMYISKVMWNGKLYDKNFIQHSLLRQGGMMDIWLQDMPTEWGAGEKCRGAGLSKK